jgi:U3 small nucleolar RNA-associated protein 16
LEDTIAEEAEVPLKDEKLREPKKIKFAYSEEKKPKDKRIGSTTYRVAQVEKEGFAPKASRNAVSAKAALQGGRKGQVRKPVSSGFVVAKTART